MHFIPCPPQVSSSRLSLSVSDANSCFFLGYPAEVTPEVATFAGGCFWGVEHIFLKHYPPSQNKGILKTAVGYTGGNTSDPNYQDVCSGSTNHAEALRIEFNPNIVTYAELVGECSIVLAFRRQEMRFVIDDVLTSGRNTYQNSFTVHMILRLSTGKGATAGLVSESSTLVVIEPQRGCFLEYRSAIFYNSPSQKDIAQRVTEEVQKKHFDPHGTKITTQIAEAGKWFDAEDYHQLYLFNNPTGYQCPTHKLHW